MRRIDRASLATYLNDHLAASIAALELIDQLVTVHHDTHLGTMMNRFRTDLAEEQATVRALIEAVGGSESTIAKSVAWLGEKIARLKIGPGSGDPTGLMLFEALEALAVGFWGRRSLWRALDHLGLSELVAIRVDFVALGRRADDHLTELETFRLGTCIAALTELAPPEPTSVSVAT